MTDSPTRTRSPNATNTTTETPEDHPDTIFVGPDGVDNNPGTDSEPMATIQYAVKRVSPGGTVHVLPGVYRQFVGITEDNAGDPGNPITLTGPADAVLKPPDDPNPHIMHISGSHFRLLGMTIDGLIDESNPEDPDSYLDPQLIGISPDDPDPQDPDYIEDLVISPHRMGNTQSAFINAGLLKDSAIGAFEVIGPAGAEWVLGDTDHGHNGEFVYLGTAPGNIEPHLGIEGYDETRNVRVHHIDNSEGYAHSELVDCKIGTQNITVEYCWDGGGVRSKDSYYSRSISLDGYGSTIRWNVFQDAMGSGIRVGPQNYLHDNAEYGVDEEPQTAFERKMGIDHAIYGNVFTGNTNEAIDFLRESRRPGRESNPLPSDQRVYCGNLYDGYSDGHPGKPCETDLPESNGVGHVAGDSPWSGSPPSQQTVFKEHAQDQQLNVTVHKETVPTETEFEIPVTVENTGDSTEDVELVIRSRKHEFDRKSTTVSPGEQREVIFSEQFSVTLEIAVIRNGQKVGSVYVTDEE